MRCVENTEDKIYKTFLILLNNTSRKIYENYLKPFYKVLFLPYKSDILQFSYS